MSSRWCRAILDHADGWRHDSTRIASRFRSPAGAGGPPLPVLLLASAPPWRWSAPIEHQPHEHHRRPRLSLATEEGDILADIFNTTTGSYANAYEELG